MAGQKVLICDMLLGNTCDCIIIQVYFILLLVHHFINSLPAIGELFSSALNFANSLDPDQAQQNVRPDFDSKVSHSYSVPEITFRKSLV